MSTHTFFITLIKHIIKQNFMILDINSYIQFFLVLWLIIVGLDACVLDEFVVEFELKLLFKFNLSLNVAVSFFKFLGDVESSAKCNGIWLSLSVMRSVRFIEDLIASLEDLPWFSELCETWNSAMVLVLGRRRADVDLVVEGWDEGSPSLGDTKIENTHCKIYKY